MAVAPVTLPPALSAWSAAGLSHLLLECPVSAMQAHALRETAPDVPRAVQPSGFPMPGAIGGKVLSGQPVIESESSVSVLFVPPGENDSTRPVSEPFAESCRFIPFEQWPESWQKAFTRTSPAPLLWSYHSLGLDMEGGPDSKLRSTLLRRLIGQLNLPRGSSVFWPCAVPVAQPPIGKRLNAAPDIFFSGVTLLKPQLLILFGSQAVADIGIEGKPAYFSQTFVDGKILVLLPDLEQLDGDASVNSVVSFMRAALSAISFSGI